MNDETETKMSNPWFEVVGPEARLSQGDIILECPLLKWQLDDAAHGEPKASGERLFKAAKGIKADVVVMTQACDLEQGKVSDVVLCPCLPLSRYKPAWEEAERARKLSGRRNRVAEEFAPRLQEETDVSSRMAGSSNRINSRV